MSIAQESRFLALTRHYPAVARIEVGVLLVLVARNDAGAIADVAVVDRNGEDVERPLERLARQRRQAVEAEKLAMQALAPALALAIARGEDVDVKAIAAQADASRQTLYNRLGELDLADVFAGPPA